jgi:hypothetical protein
MEHITASTLTRPQLDRSGAFVPVDSPIQHTTEPPTFRATSAPRGSHPAFEAGAVYLVSFGIFLVVAVLLDFKYRTFSGDAFSRMANGFYVLYSRDPHLAAIGFVWTPLQSLSDMVFLLGNHLWPELSHNDMAGSLVSALAMAGAAHQIRSGLREWGVNVIPRLLLTTFFVLNPMILFYGGNGMSEGLFLFTLTASTRYLLRWMDRGDLRSLALAGTALGFSYLTRNEASGAAALGAVAVLCVSYFRAKGSRWPKLKMAGADAAIFALPAFVAAIGWAVTSKIITGHFFEQFSSIYGNSEQEIFLTHKSLHGRMLYEVHAIGALWPLLPIVLVAAVVVAVRRRDFRMLAPLGVLGGALAFDALAYLDNSIEDFFRYFIATVPLEVLIIGSLLAASPSLKRSQVAKPLPVRNRPVGFRALMAVASILLVLLTMVPATVTTTAAMFNPAIGTEETQFLGFVFHKHPSAKDLDFKARFPTILSLGDYLAGLKLPNGDIVVDNATVCIPEMITTISQPKLFVIPNDRDFQRVLSDPISFHVHYILEPNPAQTPITAENIEYPSLWSSGADFTREVHQFPARGACPELRLFKVLHHSNQVT